MGDILDVTESQARVLRAIAYFEAESKKKGATQYQCYKNIPNEFHVSGSTFNDNIKYLERKLLVIRLDDSNNNRKTKPYTITDIGQVSWLRHFTLSENIEIIQKIFPNIQLSAIDLIFDQVDNPDIKYMKNKYALGVLGVALDSFHITDEVFVPYTRVSFYAELELTCDEGIKTSFMRLYHTRSPAFNKELRKMYKEVFERSHTSSIIEIGIIASITFLFYYNLISYTVNIDTRIYLKILSFIKPLHKGLINVDDTPEEIDEEDERGWLRELSGLLEWRYTIDKKIRELITSNDLVSKIMEDNLKDLNKLTDTNFYNISKSFIK